MTNGCQDFEDYTAENKIDLFIKRFIADDLFAVAKVWLFSNQDVLKCIEESFTYPGSVRLDNVKYKYAANIESVEDELLFDAVVACNLTGLKQSRHSVRRHAIAQMLTIKCMAAFSNGSINFTSLSAYRGDAVRNKHRAYPVDENIVPIVSKDSLDAEAASFLRANYPDALVNPQPVPIMKILREKMGLCVFMGAEAVNAGETGDRQIFGKIFFSPTLTELQCPATKKIKSVKVPRGTIVIDPAVLSKGNLGLLHNTLAHEGFHWFRNRVYAAICLLLHGDAFIDCRDDSKATAPKSKWTNDQWIEWQARSVAPRILMPKEAFKRKAREVIAQCPAGALENTEVTNAVVKELADFFIVSQEAVRIRLVETGFVIHGMERGHLQNSHQPSVTAYIKIEDAFREYCENEEFRAMVDSGAVCHAENHYVINDPLYIKWANGKWKLTDYARRHLDECALKFTLRKECLQQEYGVAYRVDNSKLKNIPKYERVQNDRYLLDNIEKLQRRFFDEFEEFAAITPSFSKIAIGLMEREHWNSRIFKEKTLLDDATYSRIVGGEKNKNEKDKKKGKSNNISLRTVAAFCVGIGASVDIADKLFAAAGLAFHNSEERFAYRFVLREMPGCSIDTCNDFLESLGYEPLGNRSREMKMATG